MTHLPALLLLTIALAAFGTSALADGVAYKCTDRHGQVSYQATPCPGTQQPTTLPLSNAPVTSTPTPPPTPATTTAPEAPSAPVAVIPPSPPVPIPAMYRCINVVNGKRYLSRDGNPPPYLAPLGMLGVLPSSLAQTYSTANQMGKGKPDATLVAGNYTWVQDTCRELSPQETCRTLRDAWDKNEHQLDHAFKSDQPPLRQREAELREQLQGCGGP